MYCKNIIILLTYMHFHVSHLSVAISNFCTIATPLFWSILNVILFLFVGPKKKRVTGLIDSDHEGEDEDRGGEGDGETSKPTEEGEAAPAGAPDEEGAEPKKVDDDADSDDGIEPERDMNR